jgi:EAL domain-containing protein (putative c-di-GMP-specific phosphodiesterase class I)
VADANGVADRILASLMAPFHLSGHEVYTMASLGIASSSNATAGPDSLLREADIALYHAKAAGKGRSSVFEPTMSASPAFHMHLESELHRALERGELCVHYQPIVDLDDGHIREVEALVRWYHPERGIVGPDEFIPVAEETGLIVPLGQFVLDEACRQLRAWQLDYPRTDPLVMSVNLSARQFQHPALVEDIRRVVNMTGIDPPTLKLEITETVVMRDAEAAVATLRELKALGIQLAIDDFGTGYSSLSYLKRFPLDTLKIDRTLVDGLGDAVQDTAIVRSVIALARALGLSVTGEGVETLAQQLQLVDLGCDLAQGYLFARPQSKEAISDLLALDGGIASLKAA